MYSGVIPSSGAECNSKVGTATFTASIDLGASHTFTISNTYAGSVGIVTMYCNSDSVLQIQTIVWTSEISIAITVRNLGPDSVGPILFTFSFMSFN